MFQLTAARRRLDIDQIISTIPDQVSTHSRPKAAGPSRQPSARSFRVSTHSRPKAAGWICCASTRAFRFNSQPPEGGWLGFLLQFFDVHSFNSQPPEGGWPHEAAAERLLLAVSTHSRPKAAGPRVPRLTTHISFQLTAARRRLDGTEAAGQYPPKVSTHSRPKAAGRQ